MNDCTKVCCISVCFMLFTELSLIFNSFFILTMCALVVNCVQAKCQRLHYNGIFHHSTDSECLQETCSGLTENTQVTSVDGETAQERDSIDLEEEDSVSLDNSDSYNGRLVFPNLSIRNPKTNANCILILYWPILI